MKKYYLSLTILVMCALFVLSSCINTEQNMAEENEYNMQYATDAAQYCLFMNKQISVVSNQLSTTIIIADNTKSGEYPVEDAIKSAEQSKGIVIAAREEVEKMIPPEKYADTRINTLRIMQNVEQDIQKFIDELSAVKLNEANIDALVSVMQGDFAAITAESNSYYE